jgi:hypothetical protein
LSTPIYGKVTAIVDEYTVVINVGMNKGVKGRGREAEDDLWA